MGETDLTPPAPPAEKESEKKGLFGGIFKKKSKEEKPVDEKKTEDKPKEEVKEEKKPVNINLGELNNKSETKKEEKIEVKDNNPEKKQKDIDEITSLIDQTINDIKKLQKTPEKTPEVQVPKPITQKASKPDIKEVVKEVTQEKKKEEVKPTKKEVKEEKKSDKKPQVKKEEKKDTNKQAKSPIKQIKKAVKKATKKYSLPSDFSQMKLTKENLVPKTSNIDKQIKDLKTKLNSLPLETAKHAFHLENGTVIHNLKELVAAIEKADDKSFHHHVSENKNDFATWIKTQLNSVEIAKKVEKFMMKDDVVRVIKEEANNVDYSQRKSLEAELSKLEKQQREGERKKELSKKPKDFFKLNNKTVKSIDELQKSISKITDKNYQEYVTANKDQMKAWLAYLSKDVIKEIDKVNKTYDNLHEDIIRQVNNYITTKVKDAESKSAKAKADEVKYEKLAKQMQLKHDQLIKAVQTKTIEDKKITTQLSSNKQEMNKLSSTLKTMKSEKTILTKQLSDLKKSMTSERANNKKLMDSQIKETKKVVADLQKEISGMKTKIAKDRSIIQKEWDKLKEKQEKVAAKEKMLNQKETDLNKKQVTLNEKEAQINVTTNKFDEREKVIERKKAELEVEGFQKYLQAKLKNISMVDEKPPAQVEEINPFQELIDACKDDIMQGSIDEAKNKYLDLKHKFEAANLSGSQKEIVYNSIRELYDDIMLNL